LVSKSPESLAAAISILVETYFVDADATELLAELGLSESVDRSPAEIPVASLAEKQQRSLPRDYQRLCGRADIHWQGRDDKRTIRTSSVPIRHEDARQAVILRSQGHCENAHYTGDIQDLTDAGDPIREVDHIHDLAKGGEDNPAQMIALCPNCHRIKTIGRTRKELIPILFTAARLRHAQLARTPHFLSCR
jgi:5-methylcytosine-specific restriction protein A